MVAARAWAWEVAEEVAYEGETVEPRLQCGCHGWRGWRACTLNMYTLNMYTLTMCDLPCRPYHAGLTTCRLPHATYHMPVTPAPSTFTSQDSRRLVTRTTGAVGLGEGGWHSLHRHCHACACHAHIPLSRPPASPALLCGLALAAVGMQLTTHNVPHTTDHAQLTMRD